MLPPDRLEISSSIRLPQHGAFQAAPDSISHEHRRQFFTKPKQKASFGISHYRSSILILSNKSMPQLGVDRAQFRLDNDLVDYCVDGAQSVPGNP